MGRVSASQDPFRAIADPGRRKMLDAMIERERSVGELTALLGISQPAVSQHLQILRLAGLVCERPEGRNRFYSARPSDLQTVADWLGKYEIFWTEKLAALGDHLARRRN